MCGTAAAASSRSTVMRTSSEPARASAATCRAVASTSAVSVLVIDCTTIGASPPTMTPPTSTATVWCRVCFAVALMCKGRSMPKKPPKWMPFTHRGVNGGAKVPLFAQFHRDQLQPARGNLPVKQDNRMTFHAEALRRLAIHADAENLDHRRFRREAGGARGGFQRCRRRRRPAASPTAPQCSQIRNTTGSPLS